MGHRFRIWYKNEFHVSWLDGEPCASSPDMLAVLEAETCVAKSSDSVSVGQNVVVLGFKTLAPGHYRVEPGRIALSPRHFGFNLAYVPIEERVGSA